MSSSSAKKPVRVEKRNAEGAGQGGTPPPKGPTDIAKLTGKGIVKGDLEKLRGAGYVTVESIAYSTSKKLNKVEGLSPLSVDAIQKASHQLIHMDFQDALTYEGSMNKRRLSTGVKGIDEILGGGLEPGFITEISGGPKTGKTQFCHTLAITCQLPLTSGGLGGRCMYIDTAKTFRPERIRKVATRYGLTPETALASIEYVHVYNTEHQLRLLQSASARMLGNNFSLLIVDSATSLYRTDYTGLGELQARQQHLAQFLRKLQQIADEFKVVVVITNHIVTKISTSGASAHSYKPKGSSSKSPSRVTVNPVQDTPGGGIIIGTASQTRLSLRVGLHERRICKVYDSPLHDECESLFYITGEGITDKPNL